MKTYIVKLKQVAMMMGISLSGIAAIGAITPANALTFNFIPGTGVTVGSDVYNGFVAAGNLWSSQFTDNVTLDITINYQTLSNGTLGLASVDSPIVSYTDFYTALDRDRSSADDNKAVSSLPTGSGFNVLLNRTSDHPNALDNTASYLDNNGDDNNNSILLTNANAKALGLRTYTPPNQTPSDGTISLNDLYTWDFDRSNGISDGTGNPVYDFVGVAAHEIGHALGFFSGADDIDSARGNIASKDAFAQPLDLFRYSARSTTTIDLTADATAKYFSLDGMSTAVEFSTGVNYGDGRQAGHWKDDRGLGIMDPTTASGEVLQISANDLQAFDVIGWNRSIANNSVSVPEPENFIGTFLFAAFGIEMVRKCRQNQIDSAKKKL
jgi:hypothetical protein